MAMRNEISSSPSPQAYKLNLTPYAAEASQEFSRSSSGQVGDEYYNGWNNCSIGQPELGDSVEIKGPKKNEPLLKDFIAIREDDKTFGFVQNRRNGQVFLADSLTLETLKSLVHTPIHELIAQHPEVLHALRI